MAIKPIVKTATNLSHGKQISKRLKNDLFRVLIHCYPCGNADIN